MRAGAFAATFDGRRQVLLCHRRDIDAWNLPGGGVDDGESPWDAAVREVREEVGLEVEIARLTGVSWKPSAELVFNFEAWIVSGQPGLSDEADAVGHFSVDALPASTGRKHLERIRDAVMDGPAVFRTQTGPSMRDLFAGRNHA